MRTYHVTVLDQGRRWTVIISANGVEDAITLTKLNRQWRDGAEIITITTVGV